MRESDHTISANLLFPCTYFSRKYNHSFIYTILDHKNIKFPNPYYELCINETLNALRQYQKIKIKEIYTMDFCSVVPDFL